ncbi:hypothetical protein Esti_002757 [Eimeria stiedai]
MPLPPQSVRGVARLLVEWLNPFRVLVSLPNATSSYANSVLVGGGQRFDQVPTSLASASLDFTDSARSRGCPAGAGRGSTHGDEGVLPHVNFSGGTGDVAHRFALETAGPRQSSCDTEEVVHQPARSVVAVEVQQFNLDCVETRQQLDLTEAEARALRENIPVVFVNGKQVSRLRFNGAAVRSALSEELERLVGIMAGRRDLNREPCPDRILDDMGGAFGMGALGGFLWHFAKGWRNSPKSDKLSGAMFSGSLKSPAVGSAFATWGGIFCAFDCTLAYARGGKEDSWNPVIAGAATGGVLSMRSGWRSCARNAAVGGVLLGIIEVVQILLYVPVDVLTWGSCDDTPEAISAVEGI